MVMKALQEAHLYLNLKKCHFFLTEVDFLGHHISAHGIELQSAKCDKILKWPKLTSATDVHSFLGLVCYIAIFLPNLMEHTGILTPLTMKDAHKNFPVWSDEHNATFKVIKSLVCSVDCLTVINHMTPRDNRTFLTCNASDWRTGAVLSFGLTWKDAQLVAYDSAQLNAAEKNYPIHEKELLAIFHGPKKWCSDLLGSTVYVHTAHKTLVNFNSQKDLS